MDENNKNKFFNTIVGQENEVGADLNGFECGWTAMIIVVAERCG